MTKHMVRAVARHLGSFARCCSCWVDFCLLGIYIVAAMVVVCAENAENKSLVNSETEAALVQESYRVTYQEIEGGTERAKTKLVDSDGYSYNIKLKRARVTYWQCTVRPKGNACKAMVVQRGSEYQRNCVGFRGLSTDPFKRRSLKRGMSLRQTRRTQSNFYAHVRV